MRSGNLTLDTVAFTNNDALRGGTGADGLGGAIFVVNNPSATPAPLPVVQAQNVTFSGSSADSSGGTTGVDGIGTNQNNDDV